MWRDFVCLSVCFVIFVQNRHRIKAGLDPGLDSGPWTLDYGLQIKIGKNKFKKINTETGLPRNHESITNQNSLLI